MAGQSYIPASVLDKLPAMVRHELVKLRAETQEAFLEEYKRKSKSLPVAYLLWLLLGWHYGYLRSWGWQFLFWVTFGGLVVWWFVDVFRLPGMVGSANKDTAIDVMRSLRTISE